ncbi:hypothetical protein OCU04_012649 [Sclerotinia nivalis]|uniref:Uncharacterized protein n=1 Tax=Sclerotinia nivalis TaxID=352851 RepID=A0A9X0A936_9HELO|nr:hypothetical protein OCU04_012649 [Sclerotinia nivalis]
MASTGTPKLSQTLLDRANALTAKANDGQAIFGSITSLLDKYLDSKEVLTLLARSRKLLTALCLDFKASIEKHFDALISGAHPPRVIANVATPPVTHQIAIAIIPTAVKASYAQKATNTIKTHSIAPIKTTKIIPSTTLTDSRLFVRIG